MAKKPTIFRKVPPDQIIRRVPAEFRDAIDVRQLKQPLYTVIAFAGSQGSSSGAMADSRALHRVLPAIEDPEPIVVVAYNFTTEAVAMIEQMEGHAFRRHGSTWTDASWASLHAVTQEPLSKALTKSRPQAPAGA